MVIQDPKVKKDPKSKEKELTEDQKKDKAKLDLLMMGDENQKTHFSLDDLVAKNSGGKGKKRKLANEKDTDNFKVIAQLLAHYCFLRAL